jgi:UDP-2,3-diacylglucosamine hydrolase
MTVSYRDSNVSSEALIVNGGSAYFVADAHLGAQSGAADRTSRSELLALLSSLRGAAASLFLVGDIFDFWFEYPRSAPVAHGDVLSALAALSDAGASIHFLGGNHDYWADGKFEALTGATVHRDPLDMTLFGRRLFIAHGDGLPGGDLGYRFLKAVIRSRPAIAAFRLIPPRAGESIARWASGLSEIDEERIRRAIPPMRDFLRTKLSQGFDAVVVGHVHRPAFWTWPEGTGIIVGDWMENRSVVELSPRGFRMLRWSGDGLAERRPEEL